MDKNHTNKITVLTIAIFAGIITYFLSSNYNLGFAPDSVSYFEVINSLKAGKGFTDLNGEFINHWPPGYPFFIFMISQIFSSTSMLAGIIGNAVIVFVTIIVLFYLLKSFQIPEKLIYILLFLYLISPVAAMYLWYLSEGLFILLILISFLLFKKWQKKEKRLHLLLSGIFLGFSVLVRFAGAGFIAGYVIYLVISKSNYRIKTAFLNIFYFLLASLLPVLPWIVYSRLNRAMSHDREFDFKFIPLAKFQELFLSFGSWIFGNFNGLISLGVSLIILLLVFWKKLRFSLKYIPVTSEYIQLKLPLYLSSVYILFILFSASFLDHAIPLSNRIFSPYNTSTKLDHCLS